MSQQGRILIVDDEEDLREILVEEFRLQGFEVFEANSGNTAKKVIAEQSIDVVVTDMRMPQMGGLDLLKWLRANVQNPPAVFLISGYAELNEEQFIAMGAHALFHKPFKMKEIIARAASVIAEKRSSAA